MKLYGAAEPIKSLEVWKGAAAAVKIGLAEDLFVSVPKGEADRLKAELVSLQPLVAPLARGQRVGALRLSFEGRPYGEHPVVALEPVAAGGLPRPRLGSLRLWAR